MAVTRIKNNQITDATIFANTKIAPGTIVGTLFNPNVTINSNITIVGNLDVSGTTSTINSINTLVNDPLVIFNNGYSSSPAFDIGILVNRALQATSPTNYGGLNSAWIWREGDNAFEGLLTTETGTTQGSINRTAYANVIVGNTIIRTTAANPSVVEAVDTATGALQVKGGASFTQNVQVGGSASVFGANSGQVAIDGNVPITQITQLTSTRYGLMITDTNNNGAFALRTGTNKGAEIHTFGGTNNDIYIQPNRLKSIWLPAGNASVLIDNNINSTLANIGALNITGSGGVFIGGNLNVGTSASFETGRVYIQAPSAKANTMAISFGTLYTGLGTNVTVLGGGIGGTSIGDRSTIVGSTAGNAAPGTDNTLVGHMAGGSISGTNNQFFGTFSGNAVSSGSYNVILGSYDGNVIATLSNQVVIADGAGRPRIRIDAAGNTFVVSGVNSTTANTGAFTVQGGAGIGGNLNIGGALGVASGRVTLDASDTSVVLTGNTATSSLGARSVIIGQEINNQGATALADTVVIGYLAHHSGNATGGASTIIGAYAASISAPGYGTTALGFQSGLTSQGEYNIFLGTNAGSAVTTGARNVIIGGNTGSQMGTLNNRVLISDGAGNERIRVTDTGSVYIPANITSTGTGVGSLVVQGGIASGGLDNNFLGNVTIGGNLWVLGGTTAIQSNVVVIEDSSIQLHTFGAGTTLTANDNKDIGIVAHYYKTADKLAYFGWQNSTSNFVYIDGATESAANVISGTYGNVQFGSLWLSNTTAASDNVTGTLVVKGGIGTGAKSYFHSLEVQNNLTSSGTDAIITLSPTGTGYVTINPSGVTGSIDNMTVGTATPATAFFKDISVVTSTTPQGRNATFSGNGYVYIQPTGTVTIAPVATGNMDNVYIGNSTPRQGYFTAVHVGQDLRLNAFTSNSALFVSQSNLSIDQNNENFNYQRLTGNTFSTVSFNVGTNGDNYTGTDTLNIRYQGDAYTPNSLVAANTVGQSSGWTVTTSRGTGTAPTVSQDGDFIGRFGAYNYSGAPAVYQEAAAWRYVTQGTTGAENGIGGQAQLWTKRDDSAISLALRVDANQIATFYGQVAIANSTTSTTTTEGALYVQGGTSIGGNLNVGLGARFNDSQTANKDFYVRGGNDATLIWAYTSPTYNQVIIGNSATTIDTIVGAKLQINSTDAIVLPVGTTAQRPGDTQGYGSAAPGMLRFNNITSDLEYYDGSSWYAPRSSATTVVVSDEFNGDGSTVAFTITRAATTNSVFVAINGVLQDPTYAYSVGGALNRTLTFTEAPAIGDVINVRSVALTSVTRGLASADGNVNLTADNAGIGFTGNTGGVANIMAILSDGTVGYRGTANTLVGTSPVALHAFRKDFYRSVKYTVQVQNYTIDTGAGGYEVSEAMVIHDGTTAYRTQYNRISTLSNSAALGSITTSANSTHVALYYTGIASGNYVRVRADLMSTTDPYIWY